MIKNRVVYIESKLREKKLKSIVILLNQFGKYKGYPVDIIEKELMNLVKLNRELGHDDTQIALMIDEEWIKNKGVQEGRSPS